MDKDRDVMTWVGVVVLVAVILVFSTFNCRDLFSAETCSRGQVMMLGR